ncbi:MAG: hypothetical protein F4048_14300 [Gammaproteobacteria bacterium]|nr:hypothetical protein [Gammaproteobacteria bacterium]
MAVQVHESRCHNLAGGIDDDAAVQRRFRNHNNAAVANADVAHGIEAAGRIHDPAVGDDGVEHVLWLRGRHLLRFLGRLAAGDHHEWQHRRQQDLDASIHTGFLPLRLVSEEKSNRPSLRPMD